MTVCKLYSNIYKSDDFLSCSEGMCYKGEKETTPLDTLQ